MGQRGEEGEHSYLGFVKRIFMECRDEGSFWIDYSTVITPRATTCDWDEGTLKIVAQKDAHIWRQIFLFEVLLG